MKTKTTIKPVRIFAIGDLHLPGGSDKPMHVFGTQWEGHFDKISKDWKMRVGPDDIVLIPGDISWAMHLEDALGDLQAIGELPGKKIMIRGNHDYWWGSISKLRSVLPPDMFALQNDALVLSGYVFCGSRGWMQTIDKDDAENQKIYQRELLRMELSLTSAKKIMLDEKMIVLTHYPPTDAAGNTNAMTDLFENFGAEDVVYGHLHGTANQFAFNGLVGTVAYHPVSCDGLNFKLYELPLNEVQVENDV